MMVALLLMAAGVQTVKAQKMVVTMTDDSKVVYDIVQVKDITFEEAEEHDWVDLGLPSGTLWATCNVGANSPEEYGDYFAWGETEPKEFYDLRTYKWMNAGQPISTLINKYTFADGETSACWYDSNGNFIGDGQTELEPEDDAATANWGSGWQMPSIDQIKELNNSSYTTTEWTHVNGVNGRKITGRSNGNSIFLPAAGFDSYDYIGHVGHYWSRMIDTDYSYSHDAFGLYFDSDSIHFYDYHRFGGRTVRPVRVQK